MTARTLLAFAALACAPAGWAGELDHRDEESSRRTLRFPEGVSERRVVVNNVWGPVTVRVHDAATVELGVARSLRAPSAAELEEARRETSLDVRQEGGRIEIYVDGPFRWDDDRSRWPDDGRDIDWEAHFAFTLVVPRAVDLDVRTVLEGEVRVEGVRGSVELRNVVDDVVAVDIAGQGHVESVAGDVEVRLAVAPAAPWSFESVSGDIRVTMPAGSAFDATLASQWGELYSDFPVEMLPTRPVARQLGGGRWSLENRGPTVRIGAGATIAHNCPRRPRPKTAIVSPN